MSDGERVFRLYVRTEGAAFCDEFEDPGSEYYYNPGPELVRILRRVADVIANEGTPSMYQTIHDVNGNDVGRFACKVEA